jgi:hypothetical protein
MTLFQNRYRVESTRLKGWDYRSRGWYFVTICTRDRSCILGDVVAGAVQLSRIGRIAESDLKCVGDHYPNVRVDSFVVMPNHVHAIIFIDGDHAYTPNPIRRAPVAQGFGSPAAGSLATIVRSYKAGSHDNAESWAWSTSCGKQAFTITSYGTMPPSARSGNICGTIPAIGLMTGRT